MINYNFKIFNLFKGTPCRGDRRYKICSDTMNILVEEYLGINGYVEEEGGFNRYADINGWSFSEEGLQLPDKNYIDDFIKAIEEIYDGKK